MLMNNHSTTEGAKARCIPIMRAIQHIKDIRFVLEFEDKLYIVTGGTSGHYTIWRCKWNPYKGFEYIVDEVSRDVLEFTGRILDLHQTDSHRYPLDGEWYLAKIYERNGSTRLNIHCTKRRGSTVFRFVVPAVLRVFIALIMGAMALLLYMDYAKEWLHAVLPFIHTEHIGMIVCMLELIGILALFALFKNRRSFFDLFFNSYIPIGLVIIAGLLKCYEWTMWLALLIGICVAGFLAIVYMIALEDRGKKRIAEYLRGTLIVLCAMLIPICSVTGLTPHTHKADLTKTGNMTAEEIEERYRIVCRNLESNVWESLSEQEKLNTLQGVCDYECRIVLGCRPITIQSGIIGNELHFGTYSNQSRIVTINLSHLNGGSAEYVLDTALHEIRHAYQYDMAEMYASLEGYIPDEYHNLDPFQRARTFAEELAAYSSGDGNFSAYYEQEVEKDSRSWSSERIREVYKYIYTRLNDRLYSGAEIAGPKRVDNKRISCYTNSTKTNAERISIMKKILPILIVACLAPLSSCDSSDVSGRENHIESVEQETGVITEQADTPEYIFPDYSSGNDSSENDLQMGYVEFNPNGGTGSICAAEFKVGTTITLPKGGFEKEHHQLIGWSLTQDSKVPEYGLEGRYDVKEGLQTFFPIFQANSCTVRYDPNFEGCTVSLPDQTYQAGDALQLPDTDMGRGSSFRFLGWFTSRESGGTLLTNAMEITSNITAYARWEYAEASIVFDYAYADAGATETSRIVPTGKAIGELPVPSRQGYTFMGWRNKDTHEQVSADTVLGTDTGVVNVVATWDLIIQKNLNWTEAFEEDRDTTIHRFIIDVEDYFDLATIKSQGRRMKVELYVNAYSHKGEKKLTCQVGTSWNDIIGISDLLIDHTWTDKSGNQTFEENFVGGIVDIHDVLYVGFDGQGINAFDYTNNNWTIYSWTLKITFVD